jgi:hypothetical protein
VLDGLDIRTSEITMVALMSAYTSHPTRSLQTTSIRGSWFSSKTGRRMSRFAAASTRTASNSATLLRCPLTETSSACYRRILASSSERYMQPTCFRSLSLGTWVTLFLDATCCELLRSMRCLRFRLFSRNSSFVSGSRRSTRYARSADILVFIHSLLRFAALSRSTAHASGARHIQGGQGQAKRNASRAKVPGDWRRMKRSAHIGA